MVSAKGLGKTNIAAVFGKKVGYLGLYNQVVKYKPKFRAVLAAHSGDRGKVVSRDHTESAEVVYRGNLEVIEGDIVEQVVVLACAAHNFEVGVGW